MLSAEEQGGEGSRKGKGIVFNGRGAHSVYRASWSGKVKGGVNVLSFAVESVNRDGRRATKKHIERVHVVVG